MDLIISRGRLYAVLFVDIFSVLCYDFGKSWNLGLEISNGYNENGSIYYNGKIYRT